MPRHLLSPSLAEAWTVEYGPGGWSEFKLREG